MEPSRRRLLRISSAVALGSLFTLSRGAQDPTPTPRGGRPRPEGPENASDSSNSPNSANFPNPTKTMLEERQKIIKKDVEKLYDLASQLKAEVEKTDSTSVLSLPMLKKAEEIEKLAKQIKDHAKG